MRTAFLSVAGTALLSLAMAAHAGDVAALAVGDAQVRIAVPDGYLRASENAPAIFATSAAALPPTMRLVESLVDTDDLKHMLLGQQGGTKPYLQVQVLRDIEALQINAEDWKTLQPVFAKQLGSVDLDAGTKGMQSGMGKRMGDASGASVDVQFGELGKPQVYSQDGGVVRFSIRIPVSVHINDQPIQVVLDCAGAALVLNQKLVMLNAYLREDDAAQSPVQVREFLAQTIAQAQALNAAPEQQPGKAGGQH